MSICVFQTNGSQKSARLQIASAAIPIPMLRAQRAPARGYEVIVSPDRWFLPCLSKHRCDPGGYGRIADYLVDTVHLRPTVSPRGRAKRTLRKPDPNCLRFPRHRGGADSQAVGRPAALPFLADDGVLDRRRPTAYGLSRFDRNHLALADQSALMRQPIVDDG